LSVPLLLKPISCEEVEVKRDKKSFVEPSLWDDFTFYIFKPCVRVTRCRLAELIFAAVVCRANLGSNRRSVREEKNSVFGSVRQSIVEVDFGLVCSYWF